MLAPEDYGWPEYIGALAILDGAELLDDRGRVRIEAVRRRLGAKLDLVPRFRQRLQRPRLGLGWPLWVDAPSFDLADHIRVRAVVPPGENEQVLQACEALLRRRLNPARPLWEIWILPGLPAGRVGLFVKLHHAVADGVAGIATLGALLDLSADTPTAETRGWTPAPVPAPGQLLRDNMRRRLRQVRVGLWHLATPIQTARAVRYAPQWREFFGWRPTPKTSLNRPIGAARRLVLIPGRLEPIKQVARAHHATVNDVILTAVTSGLGDLLRTRGEDVHELVLRALVPVSRHGRHPDQATGNRDAMMLVPLPLFEADPVRTLRLIAADTAVRKKQNHPQAATGLMSWPVIQHLTTRLLARQRLLNLSVTNVQGPPKPLYLTGAQLLELFPVVPLVGNLPLGVGVLSYAGQLNLTTVADPDACSDVEVFARGVRGALDELVGGGRLLEAGETADAARHHFAHRGLSGPATSSPVASSPASSGTSPPSTTTRRQPAPR